MVNCIVAFFVRLVVGTTLVGRMVGCKNFVVQMDFFMGVLTHRVGGVVVATVVVDRMASCFEMVDFDQRKWVELFLEKLTAWRWVPSN